MSKISLEKQFVGLSRDSLIYGVGNAVLKLLALITAPIFTRIFVPAEYGVISLIASVISFLSLFLIFGMDNAIFVSYYEYKKERKEVISSAFWFLFSWGLVLIVIFSIFSGSLSGLIFKSSAYKILFLITFATAFFNLLISLAKVVYRLEFRAKTFAFVAALNAILVTGLMIFFVVYLRRGLVGYFEGQLVGTFFAMLAALSLIRHNLKFSVSLPRLREMVLFGVMIVPTSLSFFVFDLSDRFFVEHYKGLSEVGLYSIGINIAGLLVFFSYAFGQAWSPQVMKMYFEDKKVFFQFVPRFFTYYLIFFSTIAVLLSLFGLEVLKIFATAKFYSAAAVVPILALAMVFSASNQITSLGITLSKKTKYFALYTILAAILNIILNFLFIPKYGMIGAGYATALSYLFLTVAYYFNSQKFVPLHYDWQKILKLLLLSLLAIYLGPLVWHYGYEVNLAIKFLEFATFVFLLYPVGVVEKEDVRYLKKYIRRMVKGN